MGEAFASWVSNSHGFKGIDAMLAEPGNLDPTNKFHACSKTGCEAPFLFRLALKFGQDPWFAKFGQDPWFAVSPCTNGNASARESKLHSRSSLVRMKVVHRTPCDPVGCCTVAQPVLCTGLKACRLWSVV